MKKLLVLSSVLALVSAPAFAGGNFNFASVHNFGALNMAGIGQSGNHNVNIATTTQVGVGNQSLTLQGGSYNHNFANTVQFGVGNVSVISQQ